MRTLTLIAILFVAYPSLSQEKATSDTTKVYDIVAKPAEFPGGINQYHVYLMRNLRFPLKYHTKKVDGREYVQFIVEKSGEITNITVLKGMEKDFNDEAMRIIEEMPSWTPAEHEGEIVRQKIVQPIVFKSGG